MYNCGCLSLYIWRVNDEGGGMGAVPPRARRALPGFACTDTFLVYAGEIAKVSFDLPISSTYFQTGHRYRTPSPEKTGSDEIVTPLAVAGAPVIYVGDMTGISSATTDTDATAAPEYYDLSGRRILTPTSGVTIVRQGEKAGQKVWRSDFGPLCQRQKTTISITCDTHARIPIVS